MTTSPKPVCLTISFQPKVWPTGAPRLPNRCWLVPFQGRWATIFYPTDPIAQLDQVGPYLFDSVPAMQLFLTAFPDGLPADTNWQFVADEELIDWMDLVPVFYFFFSRPDDPDKLFFVALSGPPLLEVLLGHTSLAAFGDTQPLAPSPPPP